MIIFDGTKLLDLIILIVILLFLVIHYLVIIIKNWINDKKLKQKRQTNKEIAIRILNKFEDLLEQNNIKIPSSDREGIEDESCIFGKEYYELEDFIVEILTNKNN